MGIPFYGGLNGQSFSIKEVFDNRTALIADLNQAWASPIGVGEYVAINYGKPGTDGYDGNLASDSGKNFNSTVWQKVYNESLDTSDGSLTNANGLGYKILFWTTGQVPDIVLDTVAAQDIFDDESGTYNEPKITEVTSDSESPDIQHFEFSGVVSQRMQFLPVEVEDAGTPPSRDMDYTDETRNVVTVTLHLPRGQVFNTEVDITKSVAGGTATAEVDNSNVNTPKLKLTLPASQSFEDGQISTTKLAATATPSVVESYAEDDTYHEHPLLEFRLPQSQVMKENIDFTELPPSSDPSASVAYEEADAESKNNPYLVMAIPRAVQFYRGTDLNANFDNDYRDARDYSGATLTGRIKDEDVVVNTTLGILYQISGASYNENLGTTSANLVYKTTLYAPLPDITDEPIDTYTNNGTLQEPSVERAGATDNSSWSVHTKVPNTPDWELDFKTVAPEDEDSASLVKGVTAGAKDNSTVKLVLRIPQGARLFADETPDAIDDPANGDIFVNTGTGYIYKWNGEEWVQQGIHSIVGPVGQPLSTVGGHTVTVAQAATLNDVGAYLDTVLDKDGNKKYENITPSELVTVNYEGDNNSYYFFKPGKIEDVRTWEHTLISGSLTGFTVNTWSDNPEKIYSTAYTNTLLRDDKGEVLDSPTGKDSYGYTATAVEKLLKAEVEKLEAQIDNLTTKLEQLQAAFEKDIKEQQSWGNINEINTLFPVEEENDGE